MSIIQYQLIAPGHEHWPHQLADLNHPPQQLWVAGNTALLQTPMVVIVGARACTPYGQRVAADITEGVAQPYTIVSGGALGVDVTAHRMALACQRPTIAVLPSGLDKLYPAANAELLTRIAEAGGLVLTEYAPDTVTNRSQFLARNRIVAALSAGVVVIEAGLRSGTLNIAGWASKLGRPLMAVPGPVTSAVSTGCHQLIKDGASLVVDAEDVLTALPARSEVAQ